MWMLLELPVLYLFRLQNVVYCFYTWFDFNYFCCLILSLFSSSSARAIRPGVVAFGSNNVVPNAHASAGRGIKQSEATAGAGSIKSEEPLQSASHDANRSPRVSVGTRDMLGQKMPNFSNSSTSLSSPPSSGAYFSASDPVLLPSHDSRPLGAVGTIRREVGSQRAPFENFPTNSNGSKTATGKPVKTPVW